MQPVRSVIHTLLVWRYKLPVAAGIRVSYVSAHIIPYNRRQY